MKHCIGYIRVSTEEQAVDGLGAEAQRQRIQRWCMAHEVVPGEIFEDLGLSGRRVGNRPGLLAALDAVTSAPDRVLVVYSLSRLSRSIRDVLDIGERLGKAGADLVSLTERIDTTTAAGRMFFHMMAVLAQFEREQVAERTRTALAVKRERGECVGEIPLGWSRRGDVLVPDVDEQATIEAIRELRGQGLSLRAIAGELSRRGVPTAKGSRVWFPTTVRRALARAA